jgi:predicted dehydrogenase
MFRALIVGFGTIGRRHARNLRILYPAVEIIAVRHTVMQDEESNFLQIQVVGSLEEGIARKPDCAVIATPTHLHLTALELLLAAGVPCYIEKPVVATSAQLHTLERLLQRIEKCPVTFGGCNFRYLPSLIKMREAIHNGAVGNSVRANLQVGQWLPDWRPGSDYRHSYSANPEMGGGVILDLIHEIDMARWLFGEYTEVRALAGKISRLEIRSEDVACIVLGNRDRPPLVSIGLDYVSRRRIRRYEVIGEEGTLIWDLAERRLEIVRRDTVETVSDDEDDFDVGSTYMTSISEFVDGVVNSRGLQQDIREAMASLDIALRAKEAASL